MASSASMATLSITWPATSPMARCHWVAEGDIVTIEATDISGTKNSITVTIDLSKDRQSIGTLAVTTPPTEIGGI